MPPALVAVIASLASLAGAASTMKVPVMIEDKKKSAALIAELSALVFEQANVVRMPVARK